LKVDRDKREAELADLTRKIEKYRRYEDFLKQVALASEDKVTNAHDKEDKEIAGVKNLILRYETIKNHQRKFSDKPNEIEKEKNEKIAKLSSYITQLQNEDLQANCDIPKLRDELDDLLQKNQKLQEDLDNRELDNNAKKAKFGSLLFAIKNLYFRAKLFKQQTNPPDAVGVKETKEAKTLRENEMNIWQATSSEKLEEYLTVVQEKLQFFMEVSREFKEKRSER